MSYAHELWGGRPQGNVCSIGRTASAARMETAIRATVLNWAMHMATTRKAIRERAAVTPTARTERTTTTTATNTCVGICAKRTRQFSKSGVRKPPVELVILPPTSCAICTHVEIFSYSSAEAAVEEGAAATAPLANETSRMSAINDAFDELQDMLLLMENDEQGKAKQANLSNPPEEKREDDDDDGEEEEEKDTEELRKMEELAGSIADALNRLDLNEIKSNAASSPIDTKHNETAQTTRATTTLTLALTAVTGDAFKKQAVAEKKCDQTVEQKEKDRTVDAAKLLQVGSRKACQMGTTENETKQDQHQKAKESRRMAKAAGDTVWLQVRRSVAHYSAFTVRVTCFGGHLVSRARALSTQTEIPLVIDPRAISKRDETAKEYRDLLVKSVFMYLYDSLHVTLYAETTNTDGVVCGSRLGQTWVPISWFQDARLSTAPLKHCIIIHDATGSPVAEFGISGAKGNAQLAASCQCIDSSPIVELQKASGLYTAIHNDACLPLRFAHPSDSSHAIPASCISAQLYSRGYVFYSETQRAIPVWLWAAAVDPISKRLPSFVSQDWLNFVFVLTKHFISRAYCVEEHLAWVVAFYSWTCSYLKDVSYDANGKEVPGYDQFSVSLDKRKHPSGDCEDFSKDFQLILHALQSPECATSKFANVRLLHSVAVLYCYFIVDSTIQSSTGSASGASGTASASRASAKKFDPQREAARPAYATGANHCSMHMFGALIPWYQVAHMLTNWLGLSTHSTTETTESRLVRAWLARSSTKDLIARSKKAKLRAMFPESTDAHRMFEDASIDDVKTQLFEMACMMGVATTSKGSSKSSVDNEDDGDEDDNTGSATSGTSQRTASTTTQSERWAERSAKSKLRYPQTMDQFSPGGFYQLQLFWHSSQLFRDVGICSFAMCNEVPKSANVSWNTLAKATSAQPPQPGNRSDEYGSIVERDTLHRTSRVHASSKSAISKARVVYGASDAFVREYFELLGTGAAPPADGMSLLLAPAHLDVCYGTFANKFDDDSLVLLFAQQLADSFYMCLPSMTQLKLSDTTKTAYANAIEWVNKAETAALCQESIVFFAPAGSLTDREVKAFGSFARKTYEDHTVMSSPVIPLTANHAITLYLVTPNRRSAKKD